MALAVSEEPLPEYWSMLAAKMESAPYKTYTPALGTALLARATDRRVDPLSIKEAYSERAYSLRTLCHNVLVPAAREYGFSIRNTGREPMNNQPFFRYDHMSTIDRVRNPATLDALKGSLVLLETFGENQALKALASFIRFRLSATPSANLTMSFSGQLELRAMLHAVAGFMADKTERPWKTQALAAACIDLVHDDVRSRRLNDPSRDVPGDVEVYLDEKVVLAVEARAKAVTESDVKTFVQACATSGIERAFVVVDAPQHSMLDMAALRNWAALSHSVSLNIFESISDLLVDALAWGAQPIHQALTEFASAGLQRLVEVESSDKTVASWQEAAEAAAEAGTNSPGPLENEQQGLF
ncbi:restriction endonuclease, SacI family [Geodermatophilus pulveris]